MKLGRCPVSELTDCDRNEAVYLNGDGPTTLGEAVNKVLARRDVGIGDSGAARPLIFRKGKKEPQVLNLSHIRKLAMRWEYGRFESGLITKKSEADF
jgi:hypothetical protein